MADYSQDLYTTGPSKFQDFPGPGIARNWNSLNKPTNYVAILLRFCKS